MFSLTPARLLSAFIFFGAVAVNAQDQSDMTYNGAAFYYETNATQTGACGYQDTNNSTAASVNCLLIQNNPNLCACNAVVTLADGTTHPVPIHDCFTDPKFTIGFTPGEFQRLNNNQLGTMQNVSWTPVPSS
ncbi:hypothetical protein FB45DRAFT_1067890 [Roridomyces roridus]|uniref:Uncharacterized protein n=1 Tax=Roridomyces roridus TaxID=1738132 RepID=A0AAD7B1M2_9AGAR|nr:hypothetical protein FB45DRAFT_1067890 [Roridomyces roridus]